VTAQRTLIGALASIIEQELGHLEVSHVLASSDCTHRRVSDKCMVLFTSLYFYITPSCDQ